MVMRYDSRTCTVTTNFEWGQNAGSGGSKPVTKSGVSVSTYQDYGWDGSWTPAGSVTLASGQDSYTYSDSEGYSGSLSLQSWSYEYPPPPPSGTGTWGQVKRQTGGGTAAYSGTAYQTASYSWGAVSTLHNHSDYISYDDGTYAGNLTLDSCSGTAPAPSYSGSSVGETATNTGTTTAFYSGDVPLKGSSGGGGSRPSNWTWTTLVSGSSTYEFGGVLRADVVSNTEWNNFCTRINEFRLYKNLPSYSFTTVSSKSSLTSSVFEEVRLAISSMITVPASVSTGETGVNSKIQALSNALNQIS
jgi:hypothetical protein